MANNGTKGEGDCITISPSTLVLSSPDTIVTVHSNIPYSLVDTTTLTLDGIKATYSKSDACGDLVVKFGRADVQGIDGLDEVVEFDLTLSGSLIVLDEDGYPVYEPFSASDTITVKP